MSSTSGSSEAGDTIAEFVVSRVPKIRPGETFEIVCLNGTFPLASAFARATRRAGARALIRLQDEEARTEPERPTGKAPDWLGGRARWRGSEWSDLIAGGGLAPSTEARRRFFESMEGPLGGRRITLTRPVTEQIRLAVGVEHRGGIDAFYFGHPEAADRHAALIGDSTVLSPMAA